MYVYLDHYIGEKLIFPKYPSQHFYSADDFIVNMHSEPGTSNKYNSYDRLDFAAMGCKNDTECVGIYDESCESYGPFQHIRRGYMRSDYGPNCVHKKKTYDGKYICPSCSIITLLRSARYSQICCLSIIGDRLVCFDVHMTEWSTPENTWSLGHCSQSQKWLRPGTYTERCCLSKEVHMLTCKTGRTRNDWSSNVVMVMGHRFCEDFVGYETVISINISGLFISSTIWIQIFY